MYGPFCFVKFATCYLLSSSMLHRFSRILESAQWILHGLSATPWTIASQATVSSTVSHSLFKFMSIELVMLFNHLIFSCPLFLLPSIFPRIRVLSKESTLCIRWPKCIVASASVSIFPMNIQGWFPLGLTGLISLLFKGLSRVFSSTTVWKHQFFGAQPSLWSNSHIRTWLLGKPQLWL